MVKKKIPASFQPVIPSRALLGEARHRTVFPLQLSTSSLNRVVSEESCKLCVHSPRAFFKQEKI